MHAPDPQGRHQQNPYKTSPLPFASPPSTASSFSSIFSASLSIVLCLQLLLYIGMASLSLGLSPAAIIPGGETPFSRRPFASVLPSFATPLRYNGRAPLVLCAAKPVAAAEEVKAPRPPRGITKPRPVSPAMQELVGVPEIPRTQALKVIWAYIKEHNLQDPENKKIIVCDEKLKKIFGGRDRVGFLEVSGLINPHFMK